MCKVPHPTNYVIISWGQLQALVLLSFPLLSSFDGSNVPLEGRLQRASLCVSRRELRSVSVLIPDSEKAIPENYLRNKEYRTNEALRSNHYEIFISLNHTADTEVTGTLRLVTCDSGVLNTQCSSLSSDGRHKVQEVAMKKVSCRQAPALPPFTNEASSLNSKGI